jgi:hypothetical protein
LELSPPSKNTSLGLVLAATGIVSASALYRTVIVNEIGVLRLRGARTTPICHATHVSTLVISEVK